MQNQKILIIAIATISILFLIYFFSTNSNAEVIKDTIISENTLWQNDNYFLEGNITITNNSKLTFENITLQVNCTENNTYKIISENGTNLEIFNSTLFSKNFTYDFDILVYGEIKILNSEIENVGSDLIFQLYWEGYYYNFTYEYYYGIYVQGNASIFDSYFNDTGFQFNNSKAYIKNITINYSFHYGIYGINSEIEIENSSFNNCYKGIFVGSLKISNVSYGISSLKISNSKISNTSLFGIDIVDTKVQVINTTLKNNNISVFISKESIFYEGGDIKIINNIFENCSIGISISSSTIPKNEAEPFIPLRNIEIYNNKFINWTEYAIYSQEVPVNIENNSFINKEEKLRYRLTRWLEVKLYPERLIFEPNIIIDNGTVILTAKNGEKFEMKNIKRGKSIELPIIDIKSNETIAYTPYILNASFKEYSLNNTIVEMNNRTFLTLYLPKPRPEIIVEAVEPPPKVLTVGKVYKVSVKVLNQGNAIAENVSISIGEKDTRIELGNISPGEYKIVEGNYIYETTGPKWIIISCSKRGGNFEKNTSNNVISFEVYVEEQSKEEVNFSYLVFVGILATVMLAILIIYLIYLKFRKK